MKKIFTILTVVLSLCACAGVSSYDGNSTKQWIEIESSKQDLEGKTIDVCYKLNVHFSPEEATQRFDTDKACITKCCWYSDTKQITLNLNMDFAKELKEKGQANKYTLDSLVFNVRYSSLLDTIHASLTPSSVLRSDGLITLDYTLVKGDNGLLKIDLGDLKVKDYSKEVDGHKGEYLYKEQEEAMLVHQEAIDQVKELQEYKKVDTGLTPGEPEPDPKTDTYSEDEDYYSTETVTVIGTLKTQEDIEKEIAQLEETTKTETTKQVQSVYSTTVYDLNDETQRQVLLEKKLAYERNQAVSLLKQFYEQDIDEYIRSIDKQQAAKGNILLTNDREWKTTKIGYPVYKVKCTVNGKLGKTPTTLKNYPVPCGIYEVQLDEKTVLPKDITAITIVNKDYKY
jgi:hypothetical protein